MLFQFIQHPHALISTPSSPVYSNSIMFIFRSNNTNILFWNARGTRSRRIEFLNHRKGNSIQLTLINETRLQPSAKLNFLKYFGYRSHREDRLGGRKTILIRKEIKHIKILPTLQDMEATGKQLRMNKELLMLSCTDNPPLMRQIPTCWVRTRNVILLFQVLLELIYYCKTHNFVRLHVFVEICALIWNNVYVVGCRQSNCSHNMESSFAE